MIQEKINRLLQINFTEIYDRFGSANDMAEAKT